MRKVYLLIAFIVVLLPVIYLGSAPPSPLYYLKVSRESIQSLFIFGNEDWANWYLTRAGKRITEAEKLKFRHLEFLADIQVKTAQNYQSEAKRLIDLLKDKTNTTYLIDQYNQNSEKLKSLGY